MQDKGVQLLVKFNNTRTSRVHSVQYRGKNLVAAVDRRSGGSLTLSQSGRAMAGYQVSIVARARFNRSTKYHVAVEGMSYGRCKKYWNDFEELYDSVHTRASP